MPGYLETIGARARRRSRLSPTSDHHGTAQVAVISRSAAVRYFRQRAEGHRPHAQEGNDHRAPSSAFSEDFRHGDAAAHPGRGSSIPTCKTILIGSPSVLRTSAAPEPMMRDVRAAMQQLDSKLAIDPVMHDGPAAGHEHDAGAHAGTVGDSIRHSGCAHVRGGTLRRAGLRHDAAHAGDRGADGAGCKPTSGGAPAAYRNPAAGRHQHCGFSADWPGASRVWPSRCSSVSQSGGSADLLPRLQCSSRWWHSRPRPFRPGARPRSSP